MNRGKPFSRRRFLRTAAHGAAAAITGASAVHSRPAHARTSANDRIRLAVIGCGGMGSRHLDSLIPRTDCEVVAVCDVYRPRYENAAQRVGGGCVGYQDYRRILERPDVDAVLSATPDHWHALIAIHACQAGKDVYTEKPVATTIKEGRAMVDAARRYGRVMQVGTQQRSLKLFQDAVAIVRQGKLGQVTTAGAWIGPNGVHPFEDTSQPPPPGLDWDLWLGPAPWTPFSPQRFGGFRAFHDYANGELTNWGVHLLDVVHWAFDEQAPLRVQAVGGSYRAVSGGGDFENVDILYEFPGRTVTWEQRHALSYAGKGYGIKFLGTGGRLFIDRTSFVVEPEALGIEEQFETGDPWIDIDAHHDDFFECMRTRRQPRSDIEIAHRSSTTCLLGGIALDCRRTLAWDSESERFIGDKQADRYLFRPYRAPWHL
jgi:predicted dehydrogenase